MKNPLTLLIFAAGLLKIGLTFVNRNVAHEANAEKIGAVKTHTVSTDKGMLIACATLYIHGINISAAQSSMQV